MNFLSARKSTSQTASLVVLALVMVVGGGGCATTTKHENPLLFFPAPPAKPRLQFLTWASSAEEVEPERASFEDFILGDNPTGQRAIRKPYGLAARDGVVYVCDTKGLNLTRLDFKNQTYSILGASGPGRLRKPINVTIDSVGFKFVADPVRKQVVVFSPEDKYVRAFDIPEPCHPVDVAVFENEVFVLDNDDSCQIVVLDRVSGEVVRTIGGPGGEPGQFKIPGSMAIDDQGNIYISDTHNWRIQKLDRDGKSIWVKGIPGYMLGQFGRPRGLRIGPDGILYVADGATELVQMFDTQGRKLMRFGGPGGVPGSMVLPSQVALDTTSLPYFKKYIHKDFNAEYLVFVANQYGKHLINVYAFGSFPDGYELTESNVTTLAPIPIEESGLSPVNTTDTGDQVDETPKQPNGDSGD